MTDERIEIRHGTRTAVFVRDAAGWRPDWFYAGDRPMLRFKDHEWLSIGHAHPTHAREAEQTEAGAIFRGETLYGQVSVAWRVRVQPDHEGDGFVVETCFRPAASVELLEAYTSYECPYDYDGSETSTTVVGQNPVVQYRGEERITPPVWRHPAWSYSREQAVHQTAACNTPLLCHAVENADGTNARFLALLGDWTVCRVRDVYLTPTRAYTNERGALWGGDKPQMRGYKYIVGAFNWQSAFAKDPNVLFAADEDHCQRVVLQFWNECPGATLDAFFLQAWERTARLSWPTDGRVEAFDRAAERGVTWQAAAGWLYDTITADVETKGFFHPERGFTTYSPGTRPKFDKDYGWSWWPQWCGPLNVRAYLTADQALAARCAQYDERFAAYAQKSNYHERAIVGALTVLPTLWWLQGPGRDSQMTEILREPLRKALKASRAENGGVRALDYGAQANTAEGFLLAAELYGEESFDAQAKVLLDEVNTQLDGHFWEFNCGKTGNLMHGNQMRPFGLGHASLANLLVFLREGDRARLTAAQRFMRFMIAVCYTTFNASKDPDFDFRGWANGSIAGRDQIAEFPPWETMNSLMAVASLLDADEEHDGNHSLCHALWCISRTGLAAYPAARTRKRVHGEDYAIQYVPREDVASERDFYDVLPYLAYENPYDQTMLASYQGSDALMAELVFGNGLARADDDRLGVFVPEAFRATSALASARTVHVWNPLDAAVETTVRTTWPDNSTSDEPVRVDPRTRVAVQFVND